MEPSERDYSGKIIDPPELPGLVPDLPRPLVFTNGCFDILHRGHIDYLAKARSLGDCLLVALNTDDSVARLGKGDGRPFNSLEDRAEVIAALRTVNFVTWFDEDTPLELIRQLRPDHLVKGGDWAAADIVGGDDVRSWGGEVHSVPFVHDRSTTSLIERIQGSAG